MTCGRSTFYPGSPVSSTNKADRQDVTEVLLKVVLNTITRTLLLRYLYNIYVKGINLPISTIFFYQDLVVQLVVKFYPMIKMKTYG
jgi:hypothetical protein